MLWKGIHKFSRIEVVPGGASYGFGNYNTVGRTYFVNNITGKSGYAGVSWDKPVDEIDTALALAEAFRSAQVASNQNIRNTIVVQATNQNYDNVDYQSLWYDLIGLGAYPGGLGQGIVEVYAGANEDAFAAANHFGINMYNLCLMVITNGYWACDLGTVVQSIFDTVAFTTNLGGDMSSGGGLRATTAFGGNVVRNCIFNTQGAGQLYHGMNLGSGAMNNNLIIDNIIAATNAGITHGGTDTNMFILRNFIYSGRVSGTLASGIVAKTHSLIADNRIAADDAISGATAGHTIDNRVTESGVAKAELAESA